MNQNPTQGDNRTGIATNPKRADEMVEGTLEFPPSSYGSPHPDEGVRIDYALDVADSRGLGSVPPPVSLRGAAKAMLQKLKGSHPTLMLDKLGERLAFERTGTRLYEAMVSKHEADGGFAGGPARDELVEILNEEHRHFAMLGDVVRDLGGDPTAQTPSADAMAVVSMGVIQIVADPRTTLLQGLEAMLVAELADRDGWMVLVELAREAGKDELVARFEQAERIEAEHVTKVRSWIRAGQGLSAPSQAAE
jgi:rubrerythrin